MPTGKYGIAYMLLHNASEIKFIVQGQTWLVAKTGHQPSARRHFFVTLMLSIFRV